MASVDLVSGTGLEESRKMPPAVTERDILFNCPNCQGELVVDRDGEGLEVPCSHCGKSLIVPSFQPRATALPLAAISAPVVPPSAPAPVSAPVPAVSRVEPLASVPTVVRTFDHSGQTPEQLGRRLDELKHQLKENRSQDTEMRGHVNRATIELHRLQLRLKKLQERQVDIQAELDSIQAHVGANAA